VRFLIFASRAVVFTRSCLLYVEKIEEKAIMIVTNVRKPNGTKETVWNGHEWVYGCAKNGDVNGLLQDCHRVNRRRIRKRRVGR
jgi:hypothetical protein